MGKNKQISRWIVAPGLILTGLLSFMFLSEWFTIDVVADPAVIEIYHFGSEAMMDHGGSHYATEELYARTALVNGIVALSIFSMFVAAVMSRSAGMTLSAYALLAVDFVANRVFM